MYSKTLLSQVKQFLENCLKGIKNLKHVFKGFSFKKFPFTVSLNAMWNLKVNNTYFYFQASCSN